MSEPEIYVLEFTGRVEYRRGKGAVVTFDAFERIDHHSPPCDRVEAIKADTAGLALFFMDTLLDRLRARISERVRVSIG